MDQHAQEEVLGFIGLGAMGRGMAANLQRLLSKQPPSCPRASTKLLLYNRTASKAEALAQELGARSIASVSELHACTIVCLMLADDSACSCVLEQLLAAGPLQDNKVVINHSTTTPDFAKAAQQKVAAAGGVYLSVPVWGRPDAAAAAQLLVAPGGDAAAIRRVQPFLEAHGRLLPLLDTPDKASAFKLMGNFTLFGMVEIMCEALTLADKNGIPRDTFLAFVDAFYPCKPIQGYARRAAEEQLDPGQGFTVDLAIKDVRYMRQLADSSRCPLRVADAAFSSLLSAAANGYGDKDVGAMFLAVQQSAGLLEPGKHKTPPQ